MLHTTAVGPVGNVDFTYTKDIEKVDLPPGAGMCVGMETR